MPYPGKYRRAPKIPTYRTVPGEGPMPASIMLVGERPGIDEDNQGRPFVGVSGQELNRYLDSVGIRREECYVTNLVKVYADHPPSATEVAEWEDLLQAEIDEAKPAVIGAVGAHSVRWFLGDVTLEDVHAIPHVHPAGMVVPVYHPAAGLYDPEVGKFVQYDMEMLKAAADGKIAPREDVRTNVTYIDLAGEHPPYLNPKVSSVAIDTEGYRESPWGLSYSIAPGFSHNIRAANHHIVAKFRDKLNWRLEHEPEFKVYLHNSLHDLGVLDSLGCPIPEDRFIDTMVLAYLLCVEPQGLKPLAYRHAGMVMHSYDSVLADANYAIALEYLHGLSEIDWGVSDAYAIVEAGQLRIKQPWPINKYIANIIKDVDSGKTNKDGEPVDPRKRWNNIDPAITLRVVDALGDMPEATLDDVPLSESVPYACRDADATDRIFPVLWSRVVETGQQLVCNIDHSIIPMADRMQRNGFAIDPDHFERLIDKCDIFMAECVRDIEQLTGAHINPNSPDQTAALLFDQLKLPVLKYTKGSKNSDDKQASTQDKVLEALVSYHPAVRRICDFREASKVKSSFCIPILRLYRHKTLCPDGRVRCNIRITRVSSGRLAAHALSKGFGCNFMAIPVRTSLGKQVREGFVAPLGRVLATWDLNQVEMRHMAAESGDTNLVTIFCEGKLDIHTQTSAGMFSVPYDAVSTGQRYAAKRVGFGVITGITGAGLKDQMDLAGAVNDLGLPWSERECDDLIQSWFDVNHGVRDYMDRCRAEARRYGYVRDMWGRIRYLPGAHSSIPRISEEACRQSHSHKIQAGAQGVMKVAMYAIWQKVLKELWASGWYVEPLLQIHDELIFEMDDDPVLYALMDEMVQWHLCNAHLDYFPDYPVPLKAAGGKGKNWKELK